MENLWNDVIPYWNEEFIEADETAVRKPTITAYPANSKGAVIIFPGGGYVMRADHEGTAYAKWLQSIGLTAFVVEYRVAPYKHPAEISDAMRAVKYVRYYADKYGIDKDKIAVMGSSAGGHLAASVSVHYDKKMYEDTKMWLDEVGMDFDPKAQLGSLSIGQMQSVEIAKAVSHQAKVVIFDEPTSSLSDKEVDALFRIMNDLRSKGVAMIYISHKMDEIKRIADDITVMRDGGYVGTWPAAEMTTEQIIAKMVGRELTNVYPDKENEIGDVVLEVKDLCSIHPKSFQHVSFKLRKGEILGFGGLVGAQRTELMEGIFGIRGVASGEVYMHGKKVNIKHPIDAMNAGIGLITEDRRGNGIFGCLSIKDNVGVSVYNKYLKAGFVLDHKKINTVVDDSIKKLRIKTPSMKEHIANLSGGNQQKVIVSRWLANDPDVLIMDEPTRGIDVGAKHEIYEIMNDLAKQGKAIIMISSEMAELLGMSDRVCVMCNGRLTGEITEKEEMSQANVMQFATQF